MKRLLKTVIAVAVTNLLLVGGCYGLFNATVRPFAIWQMIGIAPGSPLTGWQVVLGCLLWVLSGPLYWVSDPKSTLAFLGVSLLNSILWGACLGLLIYGIRHRLQKHAAHKAHPLDGGIPSSLCIVCCWPAASDVHRSA